MGKSKTAWFWESNQRFEMRGGKLASPLSQALSGLPALPKGEPLAWRESFLANRNASGFARGSLFEGAVARSATEGVIWVRTPSVIAARCHLPHGGRLWHGGKISVQTAMLAGALAPTWGSCRAATEGLSIGGTQKIL